MEKNLIRFYLSLIITFVLALYFFPMLFINLNGTFNYIRVKAPTLFNKEQLKEIDINDDKANVIIMMDDGWKTQYTIGYKYMNTKKMRASIAVIPSLVGKHNYMDLGNLQTLYNSGWDLLSHTYDHVNLKGKSFDLQYNQIKRAQDWLKSYGFGSNNDILIYPHGDYDNNTIEVMKKLHIRASRTVKEDINSKLPSNYYDVKVKNVISNLNPDIVCSWIDTTIEDNKTLILLFHKLEKVTDKSKVQYAVKDFYKIIDYLDKKRNDINIITFSDWIRVANYESKQ